MKKSQFKELRFKNKDEFDTWLKTTQSKTIHLKDCGLDLLFIHIHKSGEILHVNAHGNIYNGKFINLKKIKIGAAIELWENEKSVPYGKLVVEKIVDHDRARIKMQKPSFQIHIRRAHTQMRGTYQYIGQRKGAEKFLKGKKNPYDYDVEMQFWNGKDWKSSPTESGDEFLKDKKIFDSFVKDNSGAEAGEVVQAK